MKLGDEEADNEVDVCRLFATKFSSVFSNETISGEQVSAAANNVPSSERFISSIDVNENMVLAAAKKLKHSSNPGPDGIPATLLKNCIGGLITPLLHLFRLSLASGMFPTGWKRAFLFPVHKKGDRSNIDNYRGISALCAISKLFQLVVYEPIYLHCRHVLADEQHGFLPNRQ